MVPPQFITLVVQTLEGLLAETQARQSTAGVDKWPHASALMLFGGSSSTVIRDGRPDALLRRGHRIETALSMRHCDSGERSSSRTAAKDHWPSLAKPPHFLDRHAEKLQCDVRQAPSGQQLSPSQVCRTRPNGEEKTYSSHKSLNLLLGPVRPPFVTA